ncbi:MAG: UbiX family flavin prenyltransferase, partial [Phenylobacterium sp.]
DLNARADVVHKVSDVGAAIASGSFPTLGMIVAPCSVRTMSEIATGVTSSLLTRAAAQTIAQETSLTLAEVHSRAGVVHRLGDIGASIASGSFESLGMIVAPCSVRTMSEIATGVTSSLLTRAADVTLKERRPLVLMVRETPLHLGHLRTLVRLAEMGAVIAPPMPAFYAGLTSIDQMIDQSVGRALDLFGLSWRPVRRWGEDIGPIAAREAE